jgi:hypothetical protein
MRHDYDFSRGERGKYARRYSEGTNVVVLEPDVAKVFSTSKKVKRVASKTYSCRIIGLITPERRISFVASALEAAGIWARTNPLNV